jgi:hypothetical protein
MDDITIPPPPRVPDSARRIAIFRAFLAAKKAAAKAQSQRRFPLARRLRAEADRLLTASRT